LFHAKLAANDPNGKFAKVKLPIDHVFRIPLALKQLVPDEKVIVFLKAIPPGYGICILPKFLKFYPKYANLSPNFVDHVVRLTGEHVNGFKINAKLMVKNCRQSNDPDDRFNLDLSYYEHLMGTDIKEAMAVCYEITQETQEQYLKQLTYSGINLHNLADFAKQWNTLDSNHTYYPRPKL